MKYCPTCKIMLTDNTRTCYQCGQRASVYGPYDHSFMGDYYNYSDDRYEDEEKEE